MRTDGVDACNPSLLAERLSWSRQLAPIDDLGRAEAFKIVFFAGSPGDRNHAPAELGEQRHGNRSDAACGTCHHRRAH
jgi:hypothetical protein